MVQTADELLTVKEAAAILKVSPYTIYRWVSEGRLSALRYSSRTLRLRRADVESASRPAEKRGEPRRGSPAAIMKMAGIFPGEDFRKAMNEVLRERTMTNFDSPFDEFPD